MSRVVNDAMVHTVRTVGALLSTTACSYANGTDALKIFTTNLDVPPGPLGMACQTIRYCGNGGWTGPGSTAFGAARSIPVLIICPNSWSVRSGRDPRMLTLAVPTGVVIAKSGCSASVVGEPVHAARQNSATNASAVNDGRDGFRPVIRASPKGRALTEAVGRVGKDIMSNWSSWRPDRLRHATRHDECARAVPVVHEQALSAAARERGGFQ
jgi:hypothetical protein